MYESLGFKSNIYLPSATTIQLKKLMNAINPMRFKVRKQILILKSIIRVDFQFKSTGLRTSDAVNLNR